MTLYRKDVEGQVGQPAQPHSIASVAPGAAFGKAGSTLRVTDVFLVILKTYPAA
jgi:hypothetical protein